MRLIIMGPPGAGKGTHSRALVQCLGIPAVSTGQMFREHIAARTELGQLADSYISQGNFVPDEVTNAMVEHRLDQEDLAQGFLLDGYPRTVEQARHLDELLAARGHSLDTVIYLDIDDDATAQRLLERAAIEGRADDTEPVIRHRLEVFHQATEPLLDYYQGRGTLIKVDGIGEIAEVDERVCAAVRAAQS